ncbi:MAG: N4-gp56 family major capsid protein [Pseudolabrys sp.]
MAMTNYGVNDALAIKLWSKKLDHEALKYTDIGPLIGDSPDSIIHRKTETSKGPGDQVTYAIRMQLSGAGFTENQLAEGNGESLSTYSDSLRINELGHVVGVKSEYTIDQQRVPFNLRDEAKSGLADWYAKRFSVAFFNQVCGNTVQTDTRYTGLNATVAATRIIRQSGRASDDLLVAGDTFTIGLIDKAKEAAITATPKIRPARFGGGMGSDGRRDYASVVTDKYVMYLHPYQVTDMRTNTSTGQWLDITKAATQGLGTRSPIYSGALGEYNGVILRTSFDVINGISAAGATVANTYRAVLLGGQSAMIAFGQRGSINKYRWNEELFDHKRRLEVSAWTIHGLKKTVYNSLDYGTVVVSTYAAAHT